MNNQIQSEFINELISALSKAQGEIESADYDKVNPHFKSKYASYDSIRETCRLPLAQHGLAITHNLDFTQDGKRMLVTQLSHTSGQWMRSFLIMPMDKDTPQAMGSAITYCKRYALASLLAIGSDEDDDAEEAEKPNRAPPKSAPVSYLSHMQQAKIIMECAGDKELEQRIIRGYALKNAAIKQLGDIPASEYNTIIERLKVINEERKTHESAAS
jgi:hypothetical protein